MQDNANIQKQREETKSVASSFNRGKDNNDNDGGQSLRTSAKRKSQIESVLTDNHFSGSFKSNEITLKLQTSSKIISGVFEDSDDSRPSTVTSMEDLTT